MQPRGCKELDMTETTELCALLDTWLKLLLCHQWERGGLLGKLNWDQVACVWGEEGRGWGQPVE